MRTWTFLGQVACAISVFDFQFAGSIVWVWSYSESCHIFLTYIHSTFFYRQTDLMDFLSKWKILSIGLLVILASGIAAPQAYALLNQDILSIVQNIQSQVNNPTYGLKAIFNKVNTGASQSSINSLQTTANAIKASTDNIPAIGSNITKIGNEVLPQEALGSCTLGPDKYIHVGVSHITRFETILVRDDSNTASWQIQDLGNEGTDNLAPPVAQTLSSDRVMVGSPLGMPFTVPTGFFIQASGSAAVNDTADFIIGYTGSGTPTINWH